MVGHIQLLEILFNLKAEKTMNVTVPSDRHLSLSQLLSITRLLGSKAGKMEVEKDQQTDRQNHTVRHTDKSL